MCPVITDIKAVMFLGCEAVQYTETIYEQSERFMIVRGERNSGAVLYGEGMDPAGGFANSRKWKTFHWGLYGDAGYEVYEQWTSTGFMIRPNHEGWEDYFRANHRDMFGHVRSLRAQWKAIREQMMNAYDDSNT